MILELSKASTGFYGVDFETGDTEHAISVIIEDNPNGQDKLYYIQDPNIGLIKCESQESFKKTLKIILNNYPPLKNSTNHCISCFKIEKLGN